MKETQFLFLRDAGGLVEGIDQDGPLPCLTSPPVFLVRSPDLSKWAGSWPFLARDLHGLNRALPVAISCEYDAEQSPTIQSDVRHYLEITSTALHLVRPTPNFCAYSLLIDQSGIRNASAPMVLGAPGISGTPYGYLQYQQHHVLTVADTTRAIKLLPPLIQALEQHPDGSWMHPFGSIHRAFVFFCQGYMDEIPDLLRQVFWAAGLDSLFASKLDKSKWGLKTISHRLVKMFGPSFDPYTGDTIEVPIHQKTRPVLRLIDVSKDIFRLRNAYVHGLPIPSSSWLSDPRDPMESGYAYQLLECTEILLRLSLLKILEDPQLLETFKDPAKLDAFF